MRKTIAFVFVIGAACPVLAQEDRPLPLLIEFDTVREAPAKNLSFHKRAPNAVIIDARRDVNKVSLVAKNTSFYPYTLTVHFIKSRNLLPTPDPTHEFVVYPGTDVLMNFRIFVPSETFDFDFKVDNKIGDRTLGPVVDHPYLFPLAANTKVQPASLDDGQDTRPTFQVNRGDTIHATRKGVVTALPLTEEPGDRIVSGSIEVLHADGTVMVYEEADPSKVFARLGETVYPSQPLGLAAASLLTVSLYQVDLDENLKSLEILLYADEGNILPFTKITGNVIVRHPQTIIRKEMKRKRR